MDLLVLGCGNMGSAIVQALARRDVPLFKTTWVHDMSPGKMQALSSAGAQALPSLDTLPTQEPLAILIAVKPQDIDPALSLLKGKLPQGSLAISIAAGVSHARLCEGLGMSAVVRVMPNTPALVGAGASAWFAPATVTAAERTVVRDLLESFGVAVEVENEDQLDAVTALSASGPGYVFYLLEAFTEAGTALGLSSEVAQQLAVQTFLGSAQLAQSNAKTLEDLKTLRDQVTSKGGTTAAGLAVFDHDQMKPLIQKTLRAAYQRAQELR